MVLSKPRTPQGLLTRIPRLEESSNNIPPRKIPIIMASPDQMSPAPTVANLTASYDTTVSRNGYGSIKLITSGAVTGQCFWGSGVRPTLATPDNPSSTASRSPVSFTNATEVAMWVYIPDSTELAKLTSITLWLNGRSNGDTAYRWVKGWTGPFAVGWNLLRWYALEGVYELWKDDPPTIYSCNILPVTNAGCTIYVDSVYLLERPKASGIMVCDARWRWFFDGTDQFQVATGGAPDFWRRGWPIVWATQPGTWGTAAGHHVAADFLEAQARGDEITFHSYANEGDAGPTGNLTADQQFSYTMKAIRAIREAGLNFFPWRGALLQNVSAALVANPNMLRTLLYAYPTGAGGSAVGRDTWPPRNRATIARSSITGGTETTINQIFERHDWTNPVELFFTHFVSDTDTFNNTAVARWEQFLGICDDRVRNGQLEWVTMEQMWRRHGGRYINGEGGGYWEWRDKSGTQQRIDF